MNNLSIVDAHIHLWDINHLSYPWLDSVPKIKRNYLIEDYDQATENCEIESMVFVQAACLSEQFLDELSWIQSIADKDNRLKGIVPWAPMHLGEGVEDTLRIFQKDSRIKGVRQLIQGEKKADFCCSEEFVAAVQLLAKYDLHFELTVDVDQFPDVMKLIEQCPDTQFILDHIGNPNIEKGQLTPWDEYLRVFARSGNHYCKFSNFVCNANLDHWKTEDLKPFAEVVIDVFGVDRLIWASDWPHALRASSWQRWFETSLELTRDFNSQEHDSFFNKNAMKFYRL
ncbi:MAG: amidohydrolase family protein [Cyclobacteriaceae bacterium]